MTGPVPLTSMPETFDAVLLDLYDTIVWSEWTSLRDLIATRIGIDPKVLAKAFEHTRPARGVGTYPDAEGDMVAVLQVAKVDPTPELVRALVDLESEELARGVHLYDDSLPVVRSLRERGVRTVLVSNCSHSTHPVVERLRLEDEFDHVVLSFEAGVMKPDPGIYLEALKGVGGVDPSRALFVDDQPGYCDGAAAVGMATRLILRPNEDVPSDPHGHEVVTDLTSLG
jgi:putative hydrolase of the HAD superfamily